VRYEGFATEVQQFEDDSRRSSGGSLDKSGNEGLGGPRCVMVAGVEDSMLAAVLPTKVTWGSMLKFCLDFTESSAVFKPHTPPSCQRNACHGDTQIPESFDLFRPFCFLHFLQPLSSIIFIQARSCLSLKAPHS